MKSTSIITKGILRIAIVVLFIVGYESASAQHYLGIKLGMASSNATVSGPTEQVNSAGPIKGISYGITYQYFLSKSFFISTDLLYSQRGFHNQSTDGSGADYKYEANYLSLPLKAGYLVGHKVFAFADAGLIPGVRLNASAHTGGGCVAPGLPPPVQPTSTTRFDLAPMIEAGAGFFWGKSRLFFSGTYQQSITYFTEPDGAQSDKLWHKGFTVSFGIQRKIGRTAKP